MPDLLDDMAEFLVANNIGTLGDDQADWPIFLDRLLDSPDQFIALYEAPGPSVTQVFGPGLPVLQTVELNVAVRAASSPPGKQKAKDIWRLLAAVLDQTINGTRYTEITPVQANPFLRNRDDRGRPVYACNFHATKELTP